MPAELDRILSSEIFSRSDRLPASQKFIVEKTLTGHGDSLKEQVIAETLYGKGADFSTAADPIVRVDARRLRDKLREYYASAPHDTVLISVLKGSYTPAFELSRGHADAQRGDAPGIHDAQAAAAAGPRYTSDEAAQGRPQTPREVVDRRRGPRFVAAIAWFVTGLRDGGRSEPPMRLSR